MDSSKEWRSVILYFVCCTDRVIGGLSVWIGDDDGDAGYVGLVGLLIGESVGALDVSPEGRSEGVWIGIEDGGPK
jgi:hypothetical protein